MSHFLLYVLPSLTKHSTKTLFKRFKGPAEAPTWESITYQTYLEDLERSCGYWYAKLTANGIKRQEVVGLWLTGKSYTDLVHIYAIARAGFIPELFSLNMSPQGPPVIKDLLTASKSNILIHDMLFSDVLKDFPALTFAVPKLGSLPTPTSLPDLPIVEGNDVAMIFHTSGTTSGRPKPIPETHNWLRCQAQIQWPGTWQGHFGKQATFNNLGSFASVGSATSVNYLSWSGQCLIQTSKPNFDAQELLAMVKEGLNAIFLYAPWFSQLLEIARANEEVFNALREMTQIVYTGAALNPEDEAWIVENCIPVSTLYATTETAVCMVSDLSDLSTLPSMRVIEGTQCKLIPTTNIQRSDLDGNSEKRSQGGTLYEFFVPDDADNCPHPSIRNRPDGHITGDLFEEVRPGFYAFRGRNDDWIRSGKMIQFCDTKSIEDNILLTCANFIQNCVVVGHYKPRIVLFVEPHLHIYETTEADYLKTQVMALHKPFNDRLYSHERIINLSQIVIAVPGSLPRTKEKGNIRRKAAEDEYEKELEYIYANLQD